MPAFHWPWLSLHHHGQQQLASALRPRSGKLQLTDGPYAEAKEMVVGFFIIEAADNQEAVRVASLHPAATLGESVGGD